MDPFQLADNIEWQELGNGVKRKVMAYDENIMLVKVQFENGAIGALHKHPHVQISYVESGLFEYTIDNKTQLLKQGDNCYIASNLVHGCVCLETGTLLDVFNPYREDFVK